MISLNFNTLKATLTVQLTFLNISYWKIIPKYFHVPRGDLPRTNSSTLITVWKAPS